MTNLDLVKSLYAAFDTGDIPTVLGLMADDIAWHEAENNKLADRNPYRGPQAVLEGVFMRIGEDYDGFGVDVDSYAADGDTVVMQGRYRGTSRVTGEAINPQVVHWWTVKDGKLASFQQYADTLALARSVGDLA